MQCVYTVSPLLVDGAILYAGEITWGSEQAEFLHDSRCVFILFGPLVLYFTWVEIILKH